MGFPQRALPSFPERGDEEVTNQADVVEFKLPPFRNGSDLRQRAVRSLVEPPPGVQQRVCTQLPIGCSELIPRGGAATAIEGEADDVEEVGALLRRSTVHDRLQ